jgi:exonuclease VII small subunit
LIFFKSNKNELYLLDAINKGDVGAMEQTRNALLESSTNDLEKLKRTPGLFNDLTLKNACSEALNFYKMEASLNIPKFIDFQLKKENFEKMQKAIDAKRPADRTQQELDKFNEAVNDFNKAVKSINNLQADINKKRSSVIKLWNESSEEFLNKHTP